MIKLERDNDLGIFEVYSKEHKDDFENLKSMIQRRLFKTG